jgi:hypothetical protein
VWVEKPMSDFLERKSRPNSYYAYCKQCQKRHAKEYHKRKGYEQSLIKKYGISLEDYNKMYDLQDGVCGICGLEQSVDFSDRLFVDHCHTTGVVRGLLCHHCNTALGHFKDDPRLLNKASAYLMKHLQPLTSDGIS